MKLAEALQERADLNTKIHDLDSRLSNNALVQEGEKPNEDPDLLLKELNDSIDRLQKLISDINLTNCRTIVDGKSLTEMIASKDCLTVKRAVYRDLIDAASQNTYRARETEIKVLPTVNVKNLQKQADGIAKEIRLLDNTLQSTNWTTDLIEK